ncbi:helix-turn-helix transcriptional regulator [Micromonospora sp. WMMD1155]|uniref:helix-turn-helix domain-containing protein n=1 Tax=Micromonospora sp. WMMD1155 TaxID=3016094 RepID=UPI00249BFD8E|nr:helix-turn-helix transcriptional regulator [Micromonospora sp. WMMD1155]WFE52968.1 helix-turn-helix transcriptional regulator [Micromonospora sp. WMMD1155]
MGGPSEQPQRGTSSALVRDRLRELYARKRPAGRGPYTDAEVAQALTAKGHRISEETLRRLRTAEHSNPTASTLTALAEFFDVNPGHFLDPSQDDAEVHDPGVQVMMRSIKDLSPEGREGIAAIIQNVLKMERAAQDSRDRTPTEPDRRAG